MTRRKTFDKEFKTMIVQLMDSGQKVSVIAEEYGLIESVIYRWRREFKDTARPAFTGNGNVALTDQEKEVVQLKKALKEAQLERDILKKAVSIFSKSDGTFTGL